jgi:hypothetical protein
VVLTIVGNPPLPPDVLEEFVELVEVGKEGGCDGYFIHNYYLTIRNGVATIRERCKR